MKTEQDKLKEKEEKCFLLIIPFSNKKQTDIPKVRKFARNVLEVDDNFYEEILSNYKKFKKTKKMPSQDKLKEVKEKIQEILDLLDKDEIDKVQDIMKFNVSDYYDLEKVLNWVLSKIKEVKG